VLVLGDVIIQKGTSMPKIPDFSKFDFQNIVSSVKSIINPEISAPKVTEGDPIGTKIVQISTLLQSVSHSQSQSTKDLAHINNLLNELYKDLEVFRKLEAELKQKQETPAQPASSSTVSDQPPQRKSKPEKTKSEEEK
jgi:hypothetical protein